MEPSESKPSLLAPGAVLGTLVAFAAVAGAVAFVVPALYRQHEATLRAERGWTATPVDTRQARVAQEERLARYAWIDKTKGVVALPIDRAMELVLPELAGKEPGK
ncbi:MAG: hypothetical protein IPJ77_21885 [Planctomycetes bacterium]|nr:hypothetical protein [Planctomycetota bacterium]